MSNLATITRTHLYTVLNPGDAFLSDEEAHLRKLAHDEEELARQARNRVLPREMVSHAKLAIRYHNAANAARKPSAQLQRIPSPLPIGEQIGIVFFVFIAACGLFGWLAGVL